MNIAKLSVMLIANSKPFTKGLMRASKATINFSSRLRGFTTTIATKAFTAFKRIGIAAVAAGAAFGYLLKMTADNVDAQGKLARRFGLTFQQMRGFSLAASLAGVEQESLNKSLEKMNDTLGAAAFGESAAVRAFEQLGLDVQGLLALKPADQFRRIGEAIAALPDPAQRTAAARDIFGRGGAELLTLFAAGGQAIDDAMRRVENFGLALSNIDVSKIEAMNDSLNITGTIFEGVKTQIAVALSPLITQLNTDFENWVNSMGGVPGLMEHISEAAGNMLDHILDLSDRVLAVWDTITGLWDKIPNWVREGGPMGGAFKMLFGESTIGTGDQTGLLTARFNENLEKRQRERGGPMSERFRGYMTRANENAERQALNIERERIIAPQLQAREERLRMEAEQRQAKQAQKAAIIERQMQRHPDWFVRSPVTGTPPAAVNNTQGMMSSYDSEANALLRQIAYNTGRPALSYAG